MGVLVNTRNLLIYLENLESCQQQVSKSGLRPRTLLKKSLRGLFNSQNKKRGYCFASSAP